MSDILNDLTAAGLGSDKNKSSDQLLSYQKGLKSAKGRVDYTSNVVVLNPDNDSAIAYKNAAVKCFESCGEVVNKCVAYDADSGNESLRCELDGLIEDYDAACVAYDFCKSNFKPNVDTESDDVDTGIIPPAAVKVRNVRNIEVLSIAVSLNGNQTAWSGQVWPDFCFVSRNVDDLIDGGYVCVTDKKLTHGV